MAQTLSQTPLYAWHAEHGGRLVDFAGWSMPVVYTSIVEEHRATRTAVGLFDISHMGRLRFDGTGAAGFLDSLVTRRVTRLKPGQVRYGLITNASGGILDDVLVYQMDDHMMMVVNAGNREKIVAWLNQHLQGRDDVSLSDLTYHWAMIAVQGPQAVEMLKPLLGVDLAAMKYYSAAETTIDGVGGVVSRTGYTGEDGAELIISADQAPAIWNKLVASGGQACGLGARDTLRLEAAMPLYGHELSKQITPIQAGLEFAVNLKNRTFCGSDALAEQVARREGLPQRIGLRMEGRRVPREHYAVFDREGEVGQVTSGTFSPTFERPIAMAYVTPASAEVGRMLQVDIRGKRLDAEVDSLPFYSRE
ncbi:MAG: glycine cleavage system aminomethyltransferase GcvT [Pirellulales bacterium]